MMLQHRIEKIKSKATDNLQQAGKGINLISPGLPRVSNHFLEGEFYDEYYNTVPRRGRIRNSYETSRQWPVKGEGILKLRITFGDF